ncbi:MAG: type II methionyl aminopeptidase [Thermofilaceae archaeon]
MSEELEKWVAAGEVAHKALGKAIDIIDEGSLLLHLAEDLENYVRQLGAEPAFPVNISVNDIAAHYSPKVKDQVILQLPAVVKIDLGASIDGFIADAAITITLGLSHTPLVETAKKALREAEQVLRPGVDLGEVGKRIEIAVTTAGFKPIKNLSGHSMSRYLLHSGKCVPNVRSGVCGKANTGEVYAVEPFVTNGRGYVIEEEEGTIYRVLALKVTGDDYLDFLLRELWRRYRGLPFSERWVYREWGESGIDALRKLVSKRRIQFYPVLREAGNGIVAQFEDTLVLTQKGVLNTTNVLELFKQ